jgi:hypothetical protein
MFRRLEGASDLKSVIIEFVFQDLSGRKSDPHQNAEQ